MFHSSIHSFSNNLKKTSQLYIIVQYQIQFINQSYTKDIHR